MTRSSDTLERLFDAAIELIGEHVEIWLNTDLALLEQAVTDDQIRDLVRCGVLFDSEVESLRMNV